MGRANFFVQGALDIKDWLYADNWNPVKLAQYEIGTHIPIVNDYMDFLLDYRSDLEYLNRYGMSLSDVHDPRKLKSVASGSRLIGSSFEMVSDNFKRLYK